MAKQVVLISPPDQRLVIDPGGRTIQSVSSAGEGYSCLVIEQSAAAEQAIVRGIQQALGEVRDGPGPAPDDFGMSLMAELPEWLRQFELAQADTVSGAVSFEQVSAQISAIADEDRKLLIFGPGDDS